ncbi:hypothetical protein ACFFRR_004322 [Megaselia abdita]
MLSSRKVLTNLPSSFILCRYSTKAKIDYSISEKAKPYKEIPGPTRYQLIRGVLPGGIFHGRSLKDFSNILREKHGDLIKLPGTFGNPDIVISYNPDHFEKILRTEGIWPFRRPLNSFTYFRENVQKEFYKEYQGLANTNGEDWGKMRSAVNPIIMSPTNVKLYFPKVLNANNEFIERIREVRNPETFIVPDDFLQEINRLTFESVVAVALDRELGLIRKNRDNPDAIKTFKLLNRVFQLMYDLDIKPPFWKIIKTKNFKEMMASLNAIQTFFEKYVNEAVESMDMSKKPEEQSVLQKLINVDKKLAIVMAMDMLLAGVDTTSTIFTGVLLCMGTNPDKQEILREEIRKILPNKDSELTVENMKNMPYLRACIKESIRLYPIGPGTVRRSNQDLEIDGYFVPSGTDFSLNTEMLMRDSKHYSDPLKFIPERWLREGVTEKSQCPAASKAEHPFVYIPFGFGPRMCVGKRIVDLELEIGLAKIIRNYQLEYNYPPEEVFTSYLLNTPKAPLRFKFTDVE